MGLWEVLKRVPRRHFVFSLHKILRRYFLYDRSLLSELSRCAWGLLRVFFWKKVQQQAEVPGGHSNPDVWLFRNKIDTTTIILAQI